MYSVDWPLRSQAADNALCEAAVCDILVSVGYFGSVAGLLAW